MVPFYVYLPLERGGGGEGIMVATTDGTWATGHSGHQDPEIMFSALMEKLKVYLSDADMALVRRAYLFARDAHQSQLRRSGDPFITHPIAATRILADLHLDAAALAAALMHDVPEDTDVPLSRIEAEFGGEIAKLVDGVTKLSHINWEVIEESKRRIGKQSEDDLSAWAENVRKMFLAMADDIRVVIIKLADRMHNIATLIYLPPAKRQEIAQETIDIYAPLAGRLGIWEMKWQLEDGAFRHLEPQKYKDIAAMLAGRRASRERYIASVIEILQNELERAGIKAEINGRPKHIYSIYRKMQSRGVDFNQMYDLLAVRVMVNEIPDCYSALGVVHTLWHPIPGQFDDYVAMPKESLYQSLHTSVIGPEGKPLEIQIRTHEMHRLAEYGVAAHWRYKEGGKRDVKFEEKIGWLRQLMDWQKDIAGGAQEFVDSLKTDIFRDQVYVFTPKGEIKDLPAGSTPLDFAYRIHTDIGHRCIGAKVNSRLVPLDYRLKTGEIVEVMTTKNPKGPSRDWLNQNLGFIKTAHAREKIRQWFRKQQRDDNIARGRELLEKELSRLGAQEKIDDLADLFKFERTEDFLAAIGYGDVTTHQIASKLAAEEAKTLEVSLPEVPPRPPESVKGIKVMGVGDLLTKIAPCCTPVPGDEIVGYITRGRGITVHRQDCPNVIAEKERERLVKVDWGRTEYQVFPVTVRIEAYDRDGLLRDVASVVAEDRINMSSVSAVTHSDQTATITATLEISGIEMLSRILAKLESIKDVSSVVRDKG